MMFLLKKYKYIWDRLVCLDALIKDGTITEQEAVDIMIESYQNVVLADILASYDENKAVEEDYRVEFAQKLLLFFKGNNP